MSLCFMTISMRPSHQLADGRAGLATLTGVYCQHVVIQQILQEESGRILKPEGDFELAFGTHTWSSGKGSE